MPDKSHIEIKDRILRYAMELWGISDPREMDPVVDLLLDVFAYEVAQLHQEVKASDSRLLYQLSRILIDSKWSLPMPAHALMSVNPNSNEACILNAEDHFYTEKFIFGKESVQIFFTPLFSYPLVNAKLCMVALGDTVKMASEKKDVSSIFLSPKEQIDSYAIWLGISIEEKQLAELGNITLCLLPQDTSLVAFLQMTHFYDSRGKGLKSEQGLNVQDPYNNAHYFNEIKDFYCDLYFTINIGEADKTRKTLSEQFPQANPANQDIDVKGKYFWLKVKLPEAFNTPQRLESLNIYLNTYPVVNRKMIYRQHSFTSNGRFIPPSLSQGLLFP